MKPIERVTLQSLSENFGTELAIRSCAPIALFMLLKANGYLPEDLEADQFLREIDRKEMSVEAGNPQLDWSRPALSKLLRHKYNASIVSWQLHWPPPTDFPAMIRSGYIETDREVEFFKQNIEGKSVEEIVKSGWPVAVTMEPGFGTPLNKIIHAIIIVDWQSDKVIVVDPDARNNQTEFAPERVRKYISPRAGGTVVLPKDE